MDSSGAESDWGETRSLRVIVVVIESGLRIVSCPIITQGTDAKQVFAFEGDKWAWYDPTVTDPSQRYIRYPDPRTNLQVGKGYWGRFP